MKANKQEEHKQLSNDQVATKIDKIVPMQKWEIHIFTRFAKSVATTDLNNETFEAASMLKVNIYKISTC